MPSNPATAPAPMARKIVLVIFNGAKLLDVPGPIQVFSEARLGDGSPAYKVEIASETGGAITTDVGVVLQSKRLGPVFDEPVDTLLIAGGDPDAPAESTQALRLCLAKNAGHSRRIGSVCVGAFTLAQIGVLDGREATTHWAVCVRLPDAIFVTSDNVWTSAGVSAGIDMALAMVEEDFGHAAALERF